MTENEIILRVQGSLTGKKWKRDDGKQLLFFHPAPSDDQTGELRMSTEEVFSFEHVFNYKVIIVSDIEMAIVLVNKQGEEINRYQIDLLSINQKILVLKDIKLNINCNYSFD